MDVRSLLFGVATISILTACSGQKTSDTVFAQDAACGAQSLEQRFVVSWEDGTFSVEKSPDKETFKREFVEPNLEKIRKVEADKIIQLETPVAHEEAAGDSWGQDMIEAQAVWNAGFNGQGVIVGVVDSSVDYSHAQLAGRVAVNTKEIPNNGIDDDGNGIVDDYYGANFISEPSGSGVNAHGTHVSGIIAADPTKGPIKGVAPGAKFIPAPFIANNGSGSMGDAITALQYVANRGAKVVNASWGGDFCLTTLRDAFVEIGRKGVLVAVAAGNDSRDIDVSPSYPAAFGLGNQITVAANTSSDFMAVFSNTGYRLVHLAAPGASILSTVPGNSYDYMSGTSMASPFVAGAAAVLFSVRPQATVAQIRQALMSSVDSAPGHQYRVSTRGRLNLRKAYEELLRILP